MSGAGKKEHVPFSSSVSRRMFLRGAGGAASRSAVDRATGPR